MYYEQAFATGSLPRRQTWWYPGRVTQNEDAWSPLPSTDGLIQIANTNLTWTLHSDGPDIVDEPLYRGLMLQHARSQAASQLAIARSLDRIANELERIAGR